MYLLDSGYDYARTLYDSDFDVNGIFFIATDGLDNMGGKSPDDVKALKQQIMKSEQMDSVCIILIGIDVASCKKELERFAQAANIDHFVELPDASPSSMAKLTGLISSSVSSQSDNLLQNGLTGKSANLTF